MLGRWLEEYFVIEVYRWDLVDKRLRGCMEKGFWLEVVVRVRIFLILDCGCFGVGIRWGSFILFLVVISIRV